MKNGFWDRVLIFLYVLLAVALVVLTTARAFGADPIGGFLNNLEANAPGILWQLIVCGLGAIIVLLSVFVIISILPARREKRDFITLTGDENGQVRIALPALREMAKQAIGNAAGLRDMSVDINEEGDAITVGISLDITSGTHVPTVTMNMQRAVRSYIEMNCGVAVKDVSVVISSVLPGPEAAIPGREEFSESIVPELETELEPEEEDTSEFVPELLPEEETDDPADELIEEFDVEPIEDAASEQPEE